MVIVVSTSLQGIQRLTGLGDGRTRLEPLSNGVTLDSY